MSAVTLGDVHKQVGGELRGDGSRQLQGLANIGSASAGQLAFVADPRYRKHLAQTAAGAVLISPELLDECSVDCIVIADPYTAYAQASALFERAPRSQGIHSSAVVHESAKLGDNVAIGPFAVIGENVSIGDDSIVESHCVIADSACIGANCHLHAHVTLYHRVSLGNQVCIHSGVVIGADGFGYAPGASDWTKIHQLGTVRIGDRVEIGACTTIDRGALDDTVIGDDVIIDNHCQIAHNVVVGNHTAIAGCVGIAGSAEIGSHCLLGGGVGVAGHLRIADQVKVTGMSLVSKSINKPGVYSSGTALSNNKVWQRNAVRFLRLDDMHKTNRANEKRLAQLEQRLAKLESE